MKRVRDGYIDGYEKGRIGIEGDRWMDGLGYMASCMVGV
jgi:hypothetical protein